jgi:hypothetical protein
MDGGRFIGSVGTGCAKTRKVEEWVSGIMSVSIKRF